MQDTLAMVKKFHEAFQIKVSTTATAAIPQDLATLRFNLLEEENKEYLQAAKNQDLVGVADALADMLYVLCGTMLTHGMQDKIEAVFKEVHRSNMSKLSKDGTPIYREDGKVLKPDTYSPAAIKAVLDTPL